MFGNLFGKKDKDPEPRHPNLPQPLQLRIGAAVVLDSILVKVSADTGLILELPDPGSIMMVEAQGEVDLGQSARLHRFYMSEYYWVQVKRSGQLQADSTAGIDEIHFFAFSDEITPSSQEEFEAFARGFGLPTYEFAEVEWERVWGIGGGATPTADFSERVYPTDDASYEVKHQDQLYRRELENGKEELLLVSVETDEKGEVTIVHSVGISLDASDLQVT